MKSVLKNQKIPRHVYAHDLVTPLLVGTIAVASMSYCYARLSINRSLQPYHKQERVINIDPNLEFIADYKDEIIGAAEKQGIPPEFLAGVIRGENDDRPLIQDWYDQLGIFLKRNVSVGVGQMRISMAMRLDGVDPSKDYQKLFNGYAEKLQDPVININYMAKHFGYLKRRSKHSSDTTVEMLLNPELLADMAVKYVEGEKKKQVNLWYGNRVLISLIEDGIIETIGTLEHTIQQQVKSKTRSHLEQHLAGTVKYDGLQR